MQEHPILRADRRGDVEMKLLLDTNGYVGFKLGHPELIAYLTRAERVFMSPIVLGELMFGFRNGSRYEHNMDELHRFVSHPPGC